MVHAQGSSHSRRLFPPRGQFAMFRDIFYYYDWGGAIGIYHVEREETRNAAKYDSVLDSIPRPPLATKNYPAQRVSGLRLRDLVLTDEIMKEWIPATE